MSLSTRSLLCFFFFFFNDTATTEIYTLSLHDALPISLDQAAITTGRHTGAASQVIGPSDSADNVVSRRDKAKGEIDRKSTRLNSSHQIISYAVFCLKKKKKEQDNCTPPTTTQHTDNTR